jgi:hypothetical protein
MAPNGGHLSPWRPTGERAGGRVDAEVIEQLKGRERGCPWLPVVGIASPAARRKTRASLSALPAASPYAHSEDADHERGTLTGRTTWGPLSH